MISRNQILVIIGAAVAVVAVIAAGIMTRKDGGIGSTLFGPDAATSTVGEPQIFSPDVPSGAQVSESKATAPASGNPSLDTKLRAFDLRASASGFSPAEITVNRGDSLSIDFTPEDGDYDFSIPYLGASFKAVKKGVTQRFPIDTSTPGTFAFQCMNSCPASGAIFGRLIVMPN